MRLLGLILIGGAKSNCKNMDKEIIQKYLNNLRRLLSPYLQPNIAFQIRVYPFNEGAIIVITFGYNMANQDSFIMDSASFVEARNKVNLLELNGFGEGVHFGGTNIFMNANRIVLIKDFTDNEWTEQKAQEDVLKFLTPNKMAKANG